ncbi:MAG TPA: hypothetical protein VLZ74_04920 [Methylocella sp.]|nr:hypothetical protein [Methylocella sp.]
MALSKTVYIFILAMIWTLNFGGLAQSESNAPHSLLGTNCGTVSPTEVSAKIEVLFDRRMQFLPQRLTAKMSLTFTPKGEVREPIFAVVAYNIAVEHREIREITRDLAQGGSSSLAALVVDSTTGDPEMPREVWFGKKLEQGQASAQLQVEIPGLIRPNESTNDYTLRLQPVAGDLKWSLGASSSISQAKLTDLLLKLPEGLNLVGKDWTLVSATQNLFKYKETLEDDKVIEVHLKPSASGWDDWLQAHIAEFFGVFLVVLAILVAVIKMRLKSGSRMLTAKAVVALPMFLLVLYVLYEFEGGAPGFFEKNWWAISAIAACVVALGLPIPWIDVVLTAAKQPDPEVSVSGK